MPPKRRTRGGRMGSGMQVFETLVDGVGHVVAQPDDAFDVACVLWMALHGRAVVEFALPDFPFPDEDRFVGLLVDELR